MARKRFSNEFKARVALEALKGDKSVAQWASQYEVHATQINRWKKQAQQHMAEAFDGGGAHPSAKAVEAREDPLCRPMGKLQVEVD